MIPQIVLDSNVLFAGLHSRSGASFVVLDLIDKGEIAIHLSVPVVLEYRDLLLRDSVSLGLTADEVELAIDSLCSVATLHEIHYVWRPTLPDPADEIFLELAVAADCPYIVTHNLRDYKGSNAFGIHVITPIQFLRTIGVRP